MSYVDGFVVPVPKKKIDVYRRLASRAGRVWKEYGALEYVECIADDVKPGKVTSFPRSVKLRRLFEREPRYAGTNNVPQRWETIMIKKIAIGLVAIIALILVFALTKPDTYTVVRSTAVKAPPETVYSFLEDFHKWSAWSPWEKMDPAMKRTYEGTANGKGAIYSWDGNSQVGKGRMEISNVSPPSKVDVNLDFMAPMEGHNEVEFALVTQGDVTNVTWTMNGKNNYLSKLVQVFVSMDSMIGGDFDSGLADLKAAAEKAAAAQPTPAATSPTP